MKALEKLNNQGANDLKASLETVKSKILKLGLAEKNTDGLFVLSHIGNKLLWLHRLLVSMK